MVRRQSQRGQFFPVAGALAAAKLAVSCSSESSAPAEAGPLPPAVGDSSESSSGSQGGDSSADGEPGSGDDGSSLPASSGEAPGEVELAPSPQAEGGGAPDGADRPGEAEAPAGAARPDPVSSAGCGSAEAVESGRFEIEVDGQTREYILRVPDDYDPNRAYPLVFALHWLGGSAAQVAGGFGGGYYGLADVAGDQVVLVSPEGLTSNAGGGGNLGWDNPGGRDTDLMRAIFARFGEQLCIDESRVFSTGFSYGGMMSFALACGAPDMVRAIAPMAGTLFSGCEQGDSPVAMFGFIGQQDDLLSASRTARDEILSRSGCSEEGTVVESSWCDGAGGGAQPCTCVSYQGCDEGFPATWCEFTGGHQIAPNAGPTLWEFFSQF